MPALHSGQRSLGHRRQETEREGKGGKGKSVSRSTTTKTFLRQTTTLPALHPFLESTCDGFAHCYQPGKLLDGIPHLTDCLRFIFSASSRMGSIATAIWNAYGTRHSKHFLYNPPLPFFLLGFLVFLSVLVFLFFSWITHHRMG